MGKGNRLECIITHLETRSQILYLPSISISTQLLTTTRDVEQPVSNMYITTSLSILYPHTQNVSTANLRQSNFGSSIPIQ